MPTPRRTATSAPDAVRPKTVDPALLKRLGRGDAEINAGAGRARHRRDGDAVAFDIDAGLLEQATVNLY